MFYDFKNSTEISEDLYIYGDIVNEKSLEYDGTGWRPSETDVDLQTFKEKVDALGAGKTLNIFINSGGGSVFAASTMVSMIKRAKERGARIISYIDGLAASAASLFPMVADESHVYSNSMLMIHSPINGMLGYYNAAELRQTADTLDAVESGVMLPLYLSRSKLSEQRIKNLLKAETWMNTKQIAETFDGFIFHDEEKQAAACVSDYFAKYSHTPEGFIRKPDDNRKKPDLSAYKNKLKLLKRKDD